MIRRKFAFGWDQLKPPSRLSYDSHKTNCPIPRNFYRNNQNHNKVRFIVCCCETEGRANQQITEKVSSLYNHFPYPPDPILDLPPLGYNWRWDYTTAFAFCSRRKPATSNIRILDAGCGTGCSTEYLVHLNQDAHVIGMDISEKALAVAAERLSKSVPQAKSRYRFIQKSLFDLDDSIGTFDLINCVGVIHHTSDPIMALKKLALRLKPDGILHLFVYGKYGRWEISLMQQAIRLLLGHGNENWKEGVLVGRKLFSVLPEGNRIRKREEERWSRDNHQDATFADMYIHPQEVDFTIDSLFHMIDSANLQFLGFTNPELFDIWRLVGKQEDILVSKISLLSERERYRLVELLDPDNMTHFEMFLSRKSFTKFSWTDRLLKSAKIQISSCLQGWPSQHLLDKDYRPITLTMPEYHFMHSAWIWYQEKGSFPTVNDILKHNHLQREDILSLADRVLILLEPQDDDVS
ncbi:hypothetical protein GpartN1_g4393.t1 [Galdieria partita]|uniref:Methyltransferase type 12 domain-containing protein n=1 Tax=Galdieria partita TaxID=83374 RepID=A0A9C7PZ82_9RHOD|nr:hypothetical protein GpartN1_g4393.t1 [Galdieria partita]